jgi:hypothetical protein
MAKTTLRFQNKNKYKNVRQTYNGYSYDSKIEAQYAAELDMLKRGKAIKDYDRQVKVELFGENGSRVCNYYVDFLVYHNDGSLEYVEVKGYETPVWRLKWKLLEDKYGKQHNIKLTVVK